MLNDEWFDVEPRSGSKALDRVLDRLGVHEMTKRECVAEPVLRTHLAGLSSLVLVTAGSSPNARRTLAVAAGRGVPCRWVIVTEPGYGRAAVPADAVVIRAGDVEDGKAIAV
jgi:hypothetical protein